jgi:hypothetical protein
LTKVFISRILINFYNINHIKFFSAKKSSEAVACLIASMEATPLDVLWIFIQGEGDLLPLQKAKFFFHHQLEIFFQWKSSVIILVITSLPHSCIVFKISLKVSLNLKGCVLKARTHICDISFVVNDHNHSVMETHI